MIPIIAECESTDDITFLCRRRMSLDLRKCDDSKREQQKTVQYDSERIEGCVLSGDLGFRKHEG